MIKNEVVFITDSNQWEYSLINSLSIYDQCNSKEDLRINIIFFGLDEKTIKNVKNNIEKLGMENVIRQTFLSEDFLSINVSKVEHITEAANVRLFLTEILPDIDRVLYLDNDTVVVGSVDEVFKILEVDKNYARRWNPNSWWAKRMKSKKLLNNPDYFNSGVMMLSLSELRKSDFTKRAKEAFRKNIKKYKYVDQDIINTVMDIEKLPWFLNIARDIWPTDGSDVLSNVKIYHFLSKNKQWNDEFHKKSSAIGSLNENELENLSPARDLWLEYQNQYMDAIKKIK